jgi:hypothetical protein
MQVLHANILGILILHDHAHWYSFAGAACIIAGVLVTQEGRQEVEKAEQAQQEAESQSSLADMLEHGPAPMSATANAALLPGARSGGGNGRRSMGANFSMDH